MQTQGEFTPIYELFSGTSPDAQQKYWPQYEKALFVVWA